MGEVGAWIDGVPVPLGGPRVRALFAYLVWKGPRPVPASELIHAVWGDDVPATVDRSLTTQLAQLRKRLAPLGCTLTHTGAGYVLEVSGALVDVREAARLAAVAETVINDGDRCAVLGSALDWVLGEPFEGIGHPPFRDDVVREMGERRARIEDALLGAWVATSQFARIVEFLGPTIEHHPYDEQRWAWFVTALAGSGRRRAALDTYEQVRTRLRDELGLGPGPALSAAYYLAVDDLLDATNDRVNAVLPFVGRVREQELLRAAVMRSNGALRIVVVSGEAGSGKTALVRKAVASARLDGVEVLVGSCEPSSSIPLLPIVTALDLVIDDAFNEDADPDDNVLTRRARLVTKVSNLIVERARGRGCVLVIDDAHWADSVTMAVLAHLTSRWADTTLTLVLVYRNLPDQNLRERIRWVARSVESVEVVLGGLNVSEVNELLAASGVVGVDAHSLRDYTGGNPLFVTQLLAHHRSDAAGLALGASLGASLHAEVEYRIGAVPSGHRRVLDAIAVLEGAAPLYDVAEMLGGDPPELVDIVRSLCALRILDRSDGGYCFAHGIIRDAVIAALDVETSERLHSRAALMASRKGEALRAGLHAAQAMARLEDAIAIPLLRDGARAAARGASFEVAHRLYSDALDRCAAGSTQWAEIAAEAAGPMLVVAPAEALAMLDSIESIADSEDRWDIAADALVVGRALGVPANGPAAIALAGRVRNVLDHLDDEEVRRRLQLELWSANLLLHWDRPAADSALATANELNVSYDDDVLRHTTEFSNLRFAITDDPSDRLVLDRMRGLWQRTRPTDAATAAIIGANLLTASFRLGRDVGIEIADVHAVAERSGDVSTELLADVLSAAHAICSGDVDGADTIVTSRLSDPPPSLALKAQVNRYMLEFVIRREQRRSHELETAPERPQRSNLPGLQGAAAAAAIEQGDLDSCRRLLDEFMADLSALPADYHFEGVLVLAVEMVCALDDAVAAAHLADRLAPCSGRFVMFANTTPLGWVDTARSSLLRIAGDLDGAVASAERARAADDAYWNGLWGGWARAAEAAARRARGADGDLAAAGRLEREARATARRTGSLRLADALARRI